MVEKRYDKFAVASFVLSLITFFIYILIFIFMFSYPELLAHSNPKSELAAWILILVVGFASLFPFFSIPFAIISIYRINRNRNLKGKIYAIFGIIISTLWLIINFLSYIFYFTSIN